MNNKLIKTETVLGKVLHVYGTPADPVFIAKNVADWIGHADASMMVSSLDDDEKGTSIVCTLGGNQRLLTVTEFGLYEILMQSRKPIAKAFKKEVKRILKELRVHGVTATTETIEKIINDPDLVIRLATELKAEREAKKKEKLRADMNEQKVCLANHTIRKQARKVEYHDNVLSSISDFISTTIAKELGFKSAIAFHRNLHEKNILFKKDGRWVLYSRYAGLGYTRTRTATYVDGRGDTRTVHTTTWTEKGRKFLHGLNLNSIEDPNLFNNN